MRQTTTARWRRLLLGRLGVAATLLAWAGFVATWCLALVHSATSASVAALVEGVFYLIVVTLLTLSAFSYLVARLGWIRRADERIADADEISGFFDDARPTLTALVPSYREDERVIRNTLLSLALQEYPYLRVVLLIDDPPEPEDALLRSARELPANIASVLEEPRLAFAEELDRFERKAPAGGRAPSSWVRSTAKSCDRAAGHLRRIAVGIDVVDHTDRFFIDQVLLGPAEELSGLAEGLRQELHRGAAVEVQRLHRLRRRVAWTFQAQISCFERKQYASLSHEANKAMNLNSFLGLMGGSYRTVGGVLVPCQPAHADLVVPDADYVLTLDADSVVLPGYCLQLVHCLEQPGFADVAVAQTPYTAFPGAATTVERIAGATTDIQHIAHQGMSYYGAAFWVGANAILRTRALADIRCVTSEGGFDIVRYVQDRTVIEDTESTIDLGRHGWRLYNYPDRLAYSATPPDFGSLCIQRRRWANGGVLILSTYLTQLRERRSRKERVPCTELLLRTNYLASICWSSVGELLLLSYLLRGGIVSPYQGLVAVPYFLAMAGDLKASGYRRMDVLRIYGLNFLLLVVNLAGIARSLVQAVTGRKSAFGRTPKVQDRTLPAFSFVVGPYLVLGLCLAAAWFDRSPRHLADMAYAAVNAALIAYAIAAFIGIRQSALDVIAHARARRPSFARRRAVPLGVPAPVELELEPRPSRQPAFRPG